MWFAEGDRHFLAASALGLIPMGVGFAYLVVYRKLGSEQAR
jgi:hypothetical protein